MKKLIMSIALIVLVLTLPFTTTNAAHSIKVFVLGNQLFFTNNPIIDQSTNSTLVEFRPIFEALGLQVNWDQQTQTIIGEKRNLRIELKIGRKYASINGFKKEMIVAPRILGNRTLIPLRFVGEASGYQVKWEGINKYDSLEDAKIEWIDITEVYYNNAMEQFSPYDQPFIINGDLYVSGRLMNVLKEGGLFTDVTYDNNTNTVTCKTKNNDILSLNKYSMYFNSKDIGMPGINILNGRAFYNLSILQDLLKLETEFKNKELFLY